MRSLSNDRANADAGGNAVADPFEEVLADTYGALLAVGPVRSYRDQTISDIPDQRSSCPRVHSAQVHGERISQPLTLPSQSGLADQRFVGLDNGVFRVEGDDPQSEYDEVLVGQTQPVQRGAGAGAAFQRRTDEVGAQAAFDVGPGADAEHV